MASFFDILGVVFGILGTVSAVPIVLQWLESRLPQALLRQLEAVIIDIESLLSDLAQHGLIFKYRIRREYQERIANIEQRARTARLRSYQATTYTEQLRALSSGLAQDVSALYAEALQLRASICEAASSAQDAFTSPNLPFQEPLTAVPVTLPLPEPAYKPPIIVTPSKFPQKPTPRLRPALRKVNSHHPRYARDTRRAKPREGKSRPRAQSLPPLRVAPSGKQTPDLSEAEASGVDDLDVDSEQRGLRRRNLGQRKVQFDNYVSVLEFDSPPALENASD